MEDKKFPRLVIDSEYNIHNQELIEAKIEIYDFCKLNVKDAIEKNLLEIAQYNLDEMKRVKEELKEMKVYFI